MPIYHLTQLGAQNAREAMEWEKERARNIAYYLAGHSDAEDDPARYDEYAKLGAWERQRDYLIGMIGPGNVATLGGEDDQN